MEALIIGGLLAILVIIILVKTIRIVPPAASEAPAVSASSS